MTPRIVTEYWRKPIPTNKHDWLAFYEGDEPNDAGCMAYGEGATEAEAIADLTENYPHENFEKCPPCGGEGWTEKARPQRDDPFFAVSIRCEACAGSGWVEADPEPLDPMRGVEFPFAENH